MGSCEYNNQEICALLSDVLKKKTLCKNVIDCNFKRNKIKHSECPYKGIDCMWCMEECE